MAYRRHRSICDPMLEEDYLSDEGQSVKRLLDYLDILYTERQQRERIAECRTWLPNALSRRIYDLVLKGWDLKKVAVCFKLHYTWIYRLFNRIIFEIEMHDDK